MKHIIISSIKERIETEISNQNPLKYLKSLDVNDYIDTVIATTYLYTRSKKGSGKNVIYLTEVISAIGHGLRNKYRMKKDSALAAKTGAFMLYTFEANGLISTTLGRASNKHASYVIKVENDEILSELWNTVEINAVEKLPSLVPYADWTSTRHETGAIMIKTGNKDVVSKVRPETHPIIFDCINKSQKIGWRVNEELYSIYLWALRNKTDAFSDIWESQNPEAKATKLREAKAIGNIAKRMLGHTFYHLYYYDFRGRKYQSTAYFHEQGTDLSKGLLLREDKKALGEEGFFWLLVSIASNWAGPSGREDGAKTDKIPLQDRFDWVMDNEEIILSYAESPKVNQGWMQADKAWQFLAACNELKNLRVWQYHNGEDYTNYNYESSLECYIDGSNNGSQHLSALTKDEVTAPHVNLVPLELPGDLYKYVADYVWARLEEQKALLTKKEIAESEHLIDNLIQCKKEIYNSEFRSDHRKELLDKIRALRDSNEELIRKSAVVFWCRIKDDKQKRKVVKR